MKIGVVIPSRLQTRPGGLLVEEYGPELWLDGALACAQNQEGYCPRSVSPKPDWKIFIGVDPRAFVPLYVYKYAYKYMHVIRGELPGQACAVNAAARAAAAQSDVLLFLEDDDRWLTSKTRIQLPYLDEFDFVSCSQRLVGELGAVVGVSDYPVPSGWAMKTELWRRLGGFAEDFRWLVDTEWLGRLDKIKVRRAHLVDETVMRLRDKLDFVARFSEVIPVPGQTFLVDRTVNTQGGMAKVFDDPEATLEAADEEAKLRARFGCYPW